MNNTEKVYLISSVDFEDFLKKDKEQQFNNILGWGPHRVFKNGYIYLHLFNEKEALKELKNRQIKLYVGEYLDHYKLCLGSTAKLKYIKTDIISIKQI